MTIHGFETPYWRSISYLVAENGHALLVDPCELAGLTMLLQESALVLDYALITHEHCDHIMGVQWAQELGAVAVSTTICNAHMREPGKNAAYYFNEFSKIQEKLSCGQANVPEDFSCWADMSFDGKLMLQWQGHTLEMVMTPGHSPGSMCVCMDRTVLFSGDTLWCDAPTNTRFPGGDKKQLLSITEPWLATLPPDMMVYPGHFTPFRMGDRVKDCNKRGQTI